ncbi:uncharacterized protein LOC115366132 isoform X4 [Myripristis murdjan]|uniref:uncharacterized protein LOC115366132 isoform X4 n=1 Tax=Myripristis murdjan TaxID=586833 RepID=UPI001175FB6D|nr:BTB/POZ domain-containing protein 18 isoform X4 [Myripristis murdjan]
MWCYQRPGFTALLLAELQRQQQCSQFCDTVLQAEGILVPAHSCVLSALSTQLSCALSSTPPPPAGQKHLVDFQTLRACTLLQIMRLLYSGEMGGEGERERQEAIAAAAKLGISGLVEVRKGDHNDRREGLGQQKEAGVQTELLTCEGNGARQSKWTKEVRDGSTLLWKETPSGGERDIGTQTEELEWSAAPSSHPATPLQTIDRTAIQTSAEPDSHLLPPNTPYIPVSLCPKDGNQASDHPSPSSVLIAPSEESTAAGHTPVFVLPPSHFSALPLSPSISHASAALSTQDTQVPPVFAADSQSWWAEAQEASRKVMAAEGGEGEGFEQFQGNIPGFISYFLNPDKKENPQGRRAGRKRGGTGGTRRAGTGEGGARRGRSRKRETTDIEKVVVSKLQNSWMRWRWGVQASRTGKGGGTTGRKFYHQTREHLQSNKTRRRCGKAWQISQMAVSLPAGSERGGQAQRGRKRSATQQLPQPKVPGTVRGPGRPLGRKKKSLKKQTRVGKPDEEPDKSDETTKIVLDQGGKAAQQPVQMPMVTQETTGPLPGGKTDVASQFSCQSLQVQSTTKSGTAETSPPLVKYPVNSFPGEDGTFKWTRKTYPIRSRLKQANIMQSTPLVEETEEHPPADSLPEDKAQLAQLIRINQNNLQKGNAKNKFKTKQSSSRKKRQVGNSSNVESLRVSVSPPVECFGMDEKIEKSKDKQKEVKVLSEGVALGTSRRAEKRCTESEEEKSSEADVAKRVCLEQVVPTTSKPWAPGLEPVLSVSEPQPRTQDGSQEVAVTVEMEDEVDVEVLSQPDDENNRDWLLWTCKGGGDISQEGEQEEEEDTAWTNIKLMDEETENSSDKAIVVDGDSDATPDLDDLEFSCEEQAENWPNVLNVKAKTPVWSHLGVAKPPLSPPSQPAAEVSLGSTGSWEEEGEEDEVDVIGGSSPVPEALPISWTEPSESGEEQEEIDVTGVEMDYVSSTSLLSSLLQTGKEVGVLPPCHLCSGREELCAKCWLFVQNQMETLSCGENLQRKQCVIICKEAKASLIKINKNRTDVQLIELSIKN